MLTVLGKNCLSKCRLLKKPILQDNLKYPKTWFSKLTEDGNAGINSTTEPEEYVNETHSDTEYESYKASSAEKLLKESRLDMDNVQLEFPSDVDDYSQQFENYHAWKTSQEKHAYRPKVDPNETSVLLFPGQGSQFVGMGKQLLDYPNVLEMYRLASGILGYDILELCLNGPQKKLDKTEFCQPAILVTSLAAVEKLRHENPNAVESCITALGFSVGEIAAMVFAGSFSFEDAVRLVKVRAEAMQKASERQPSGMMTVLLSPKHKIKFACHASREYCREQLQMEHPVCQVANYLYPDSKVIAGNEEALQFIEKIPEEFGIKRIKRLPVSGAFHTNLMYAASKAVKAELETIDIQLPVINVHSNASSYRHNTVTGIRKSLTEQVYKPVLWEQIMHIVFSRRVGESFPYTYEVGPGRQLGTLLRMVNKKAFTQYTHVKV